MKISDRGLELIMSFEGLQLEAYQCQAKVWTIGYGHTKDVKEKDKISKDKAIELLLEDIEKFENYISISVHVDLKQCEFDALVSFCFNVGKFAFKNSTLLKKLNNNQYKEAADELLRWNKVKGFENKGLIKRRFIERDLFLEALR